MAPLKSKTHLQSESIIILKAREKCQKIIVSLAACKHKNVKQNHFPKHHLPFFKIQGIGFIILY